MLGRRPGIDVRRPRLAWLAAGRTSRLVLLTLGYPVSALREDRSFVEAVHLADRASDLAGRGFGHEPADPLRRRGDHELGSGADGGG